VEELDGDVVEWNAAFRAHRVREASVGVTNLPILPRDVYARFANYGVCKIVVAKATVTYG